MEDETIALATAFFTGLLVMVNLGLFWVSMRAANAAKASADLMTKEFRLARRPVMHVVWDNVFVENLKDVMVGGVICTSPNTPMFLRSIEVAVLKNVRTGYVIAMTDLPCMIITERSTYQVDPVRISDAYTGPMHERHVIVTGAIRVKAKMGPVGLPEHEESVTVVTSIRCNGTIGVTWHEQHEPEQPKPSTWKRFCDHQDRIRREMGGPE